MYTGISTALTTANEAAGDFFSAGDKSSFECSADDISSTTYYFQPQLPASLRKLGSAALSRMAALALVPLPFFSSVKRLMKYRLL